MKPQTFYPLEKCAIVNYGRHDIMQNTRMILQKILIHAHMLSRAGWLKVRVYGQNAARSVRPADQETNIFLSVPTLLSQ